MTDTHTTADKRGAIVHFAVGQDNVSMTTRLINGKTRFLPFNRGRGISIIDVPCLILNVGIRTYRGGVAILFYWDLLNLVFRFKRGGTGSDLAGNPLSLEAADCFDRYLVSLQFNILSAMNFVRESACKGF